MSNIFANCSYHSSYEPYFLNCTNTTDQCTLIQYVEKVQSIMYWVGIMIPFILFIVAFFLNGYFMFILIPEFRKMNDRTKKQYIFVVSRGISSFSASLIMMIMRGMQLFSPTFTILLLFFIVDDLSFYTLLGSYVASALLLYLATIRPIYYSLRISVKTVYKLAAINLIGSVIISTINAVFQAANNSESGFECNDTCQYIINITMFSIIAISFTIPIITLSFVLASLYCYKNRAESIGSFSSDSSTFSSARTRLAWTLFTFTLLSLGEAIPASFMVSITINGDITLCENFYIADHLIFPAFMTSFQTLAWSIALIVDPVCGLIFDPKVRKVVGRHISYLKRKVSQMFERCCFRSDSVKSIEESEKEEDTIEESLRDHSVQFPTSSE